MALPLAQGLYDPSHEQDACGVGFVAHIKGVKSHEIVQNGLRILLNLDHRGATGADELFGDGAGILLQIPDELFRDEMAARGVKLPPPGEYGVGMVFLPKENASRRACEQELERTVRAEGQVVLGWRDVPLDKDMEISPLVRASEPVIRQLFVGRGHDVMVQDALERKLYLIRKLAAHRIRSLDAQARHRVLRAVDVQPHHRLQGPAAGRPGGALLQGPGRPALQVGAGAGAPAFLDQHLPGLGTGASVPHGRPQRRDQHRQGQLQLDARARRHDAVRRARRRPARSSIR